VALANINPTFTSAWNNLQAHFEQIKSVQIQDLFQLDTARVDKFHIIWQDFILDYSKNKITSETMELLQELANEVKLPDAIKQYFGGGLINQTENRAVLHTALRANSWDEIFIDGQNVVPQIQAVKYKMYGFCDRVITGEYKGFTGKPFTDVVNIGIGGSDLGPALLNEALAFYKNHLKVHFVSNIDGDHVQEVIKDLNPESTLFVIISKTFTTQETMTNSEVIKTWFLKAGTMTDVSKHFVAISADLQKATSFGISLENVFSIWEWVGGRFSIWSAVGMSACLAIGPLNFEQILNGANKMDVHFESTPFEKNLPVIMALLSIWYNNFYGAETEAVLPYTQYLKKLAPYLQQGMMESNGKSMGRDGKPVNYQTGTIIWGETGTNAQHAFFQLIHQGTKLIPVDFIGFKESLHGEQLQHDKLMSNFFAQTEALMMGKAENQLIQEMAEEQLSNINDEFLLPFKVFNGNNPTNTLLIKKLTPFNMGALIALYEHKLFVQGIIWNIFSFDQWGVELGKQLATSILKEIEQKQVKRHDASTSFLLNKYIN
jgi:glucose-6-phosphate isomerase